MKIDELLVRRLVASQFPQWKELPIRAVLRSGWDNRTFHLGDEMLVRLPSGADYALQVEKEHQWLPKLRLKLPLPIPAPLAMGEPGEGYPWKWSIYQWLDGESAASAKVDDLSLFAKDLAEFLIALERIDSAGGPAPGLHSFYRGGSLIAYDTEMRQAMRALEGVIDIAAVLDLWETAIGTDWEGAPVWVHGDVSVGNLLVKEGRLSGVIDFGQLAVGDPACDLPIAWTLFRGESRKVFEETLLLDPATWLRGKAWTLWKASIIAAGLVGSNAVEGEQPLRIIDEVLC